VGRRVPCTYRRAGRGSRIWRGAGNSESGIEHPPRNGVGGWKWPVPDQLLNGLGVETLEGMDDLRHSFSKFSFIYFVTYVLLG
jgi:hypothetical protein